MKIRNGSDDVIIYDLQFFAKEGPGGEKTEKPTSKKREQAREEGQVAKSIEINTAFLLIFMFAGLKIFGSYVNNRIIEMFHFTFNSFEIVNNFTTVQFSTGFAVYVFQNIIEIVFPFFTIAFITGIVINIMQVGWHPTLKPLKPKFSKLNPINGFKRLFSLRAVIELLKSLFKVAIIAIIIYTSVKGEVETMLVLFNMEMIQVVQWIGNLAVSIGIKVGIFYIFLALGDYLYQRYDLEQNLMMTKQEIKEEHKMQEGNPEIKGKIRQKMREISMRRMMQELPKADVVITNPTHFAVAIMYDSQVSGAPMVIAKGTDFLAAKIKKIAAENTIEVVENKPLARTLYYTVDIGDEVPPELYQAVAEVLAFVYNLKKD